MGWGKKVAEEDKTNLDGAHLPVGASDAAAEAIPKGGGDSCGYPLLPRGGGD